MAADQFSLCWDNFHSNMSSGLSSLLKSEALVDVTLAAEGKFLKAHKMVLSVCSPYFRELFEANPCKHPIVFLKDVSFNAVSNLLEFMYQGEVRVSQDELGTFIKTAEALKIKGLTGDGSNTTENETESNQSNNEITPLETNPSPIRRSIREKSPAPPKKLLGPASKRFKSDVEQQQHMRSEQTNETVVEKPANTQNQIMHFKMEPEEIVAVTNDDEVTYDDSAMDDMAMDNSSDYILGPATDSELKEVKAGTSSMAHPPDAGGENQEIVTFVQGTKGMPQLVIRDYLYVKHMGSFAKISYWKCRLYDRGLCKARCSLRPRHITLSGVHSHLPDVAILASRAVLCRQHYLVQSNHH